MNKLKRLLATILLYAIAFVPLIGLLWEQEFGGFRFNWLVYPVIFFNVFLITLATNTIPQKFLNFCCLIFFYVFFIVFQEGDLESCIRIFFSILPLFYLDRIGTFTADETRSKAIRIFVICLIPALVIGLLQFLGYVEFRDYDSIGGENVGRMSGGYSKPNNFVMFLFPLFLLGIDLHKRRWFLASCIIIGTLVLVLLTGLRTAQLIYIAILAFLVHRKLFIEFVLYYYKYYLNFIIGIVAFVVTFFVYQAKGYIDAFRGRFPLWESHSNEFFHSNILNILFGRSKVFLDNPHILIKEGFYHNPKIESLNEAHNNSFRIIIIFGIVGYFLYATVMRFFVMKMLRSSLETRDKFIIAASFFCMIVYSVTNEPAFYPAIFWCILFWVFIKAPGTFNSEQLF
jgi:hypothetical protein